jgi:hypothetical protein
MNKWLRNNVTRTFHLPYCGKDCTTHDCKDLVRVPKSHLTLLRVNVNVNHVRGKIHHKVSNGELTVF